MNDELNNAATRQLQMMLGQQAFEIATLRAKLEVMAEELARLAAHESGGNDGE